MMLTRTDRVEVYQYTTDYEYTGNKYDSINQAVRLGGAHLAGVQGVLKSGGISRNYRYSIVAPVIDSLTGKLVLPVQDRNLDPLKGTGSSTSTPIQIKHMSSEVIMYFASMRRAIDAVQSQQV